MVAGVLMIHIVVVLWLIHSSSVVSDFVALPGCRRYCGSVDISYPFGIGENCFFDKWFEIDCKRNNKTAHPGDTDIYTPYLKSIGLQVDYMNRNSLRVFIPVNFSNYGGRISSYDIRRTPFSFSAGSNNFVGIGCDIIAHMADISVWCATSACSSNDSDKYFVGCEADLIQNIRIIEPVVLPTFHNKLIMSNSTRLGQNNVSGFGFLADRGWLSQFEGSSVSLRFDRKRFADIVENVPVLLDWEFYNATWASFRLNNETTYCETNVRWFQEDNSFYSNSTFQCFCKAGYDGNPYLPSGCFEFVKFEIIHEPKRFNWKLVVIGVLSAIGALVLVLLVWRLYKVGTREVNRRKKEKYFKRNGGLLLQQQISSSDGNIEKTKVFSSYELEKATDHFNVDRVLGQGGQGTVYKGMLSDGRIVAVKKSILVDTANVGQFINEVVVLSQINHRNVVKLLGCCLETEVPLLVYEFIINGTLFQHIHNPNEDFPLTWEIRLRIGAEIAGAISYMHSAASLPIYHRDIKSTDILLDDKYKARVSDFGTSRSVDVDKTHFTTLVQGTFGYLDPEYFRSSQFTEKSDVYSFGVVLVELLTGRKPIFSNTSQEVKGLAQHFIDLMEQNQFLEMIDPQIADEGKMEEIVAVAHLAKMCLHLSGKRRPTMKEVAVQLEGIKMSRGKITTLDNYEVIEEYGTDFAEGFETCSTSTGTWCKDKIVSSLDELPFLTYP